MAELKFQDIDQYLNQLTKDKIPCVFLISGERYLTIKAFEKVLDFIIPKDKRQFGYESLEGEDAGIPEIIERISTYSMMQNQLVVAVKDALLFPGKGSPQTPGFSKQNIINLQQLIEKGFPAHHCLILTTSAADKRRAFFKAVKKKGVVIDCTILPGSGQADKKQQLLLLHQITKNILSKTDKTLSNDAFTKLIDKTGFDPAVFSDNLEKLISFVGDKKVISVNHVLAIVKRTKHDPVFEFTNAIAERKSSKALFYNRSLLNAGLHPLQILTAMTNQIRKLMVSKNFVDKSRETGKFFWHEKQNYNQFRQITMPEVIKWDTALLEKIEKLNDKSKKTSTRISKRISKNISKDLFIAVNPKNTYPVYQTFLKSDNFSMDELAQILMDLSELDFRLKSSAGSWDVLLENLIMKICR